jgi:dephospho-CoA kinase
MKLLILGHARHGKDSFAEILQEQFGFRFKSSSVAASEIFIYDVLKENYGYESPEECFEDRVNHRQEWHEMICEYNEHDKARLAKDILKDADCYVGMRSGLEIEECVKQELFDLIIWVDASERLPLEGKESFNIDESYADFIVPNNGTLEEFTNRVRRIGGVFEQLFEKKIKKV